MKKTVLYAILFLLTACNNTEQDIQPKQRMQTEQHDWQLIFRGTKKYAPMYVDSRSVLASSNNPSLISFKMLWLCEACKKPYKSIVSNATLNCQTKVLIGSKDTYGYSKPDGTGKEMKDTDSDYQKPVVLDIETDESNQNLFKFICN